ncbi:MAG TPA: alpha/beta hydrolase, partial [Acidimicrobiia bacterium]|nr:alpha/beta hydrolase [Acidimicrobiia bacterium]
MHRVSRIVVLAALVAGSACSSGAPKASEHGAAAITTTAAPGTTTAPTTTVPPTTTATVAPPPTSAKPAPSPPVTSPGGLAWRACGALQCAGLSVPRDYADPAGPALTLALARKPARTPAARIGSLLVNPGGPGDSGVDDLPGELRSLTATLQNRFDIVSWDPRGV